MHFILKASTAVIVALAAFLWRLPQSELDFDGFVLPLAQTYGDKTTETPLEGKIIVITGATNGIGYSLTKALSKLGATVVGIGRNEKKLAALKQEIPSVMTFQADLGDLASVARMADTILQKLSHVDVLINNAGIHGGHTQNLITGAYSGLKADALDLVFVTNYLSHFLLTHKLMPLFNLSDQPKVVQMSSSYHWEVDGSDLVASLTSNEPPIAARPGGSLGLYIFRSQRSYANSKLAQIYHARILRQEYKNLRAVSVCPAWAGTQIAGQRGSIAHAIINKLGYAADGWGISSALYAILDSKQSPEDDFYTNTGFWDWFAPLFPLLPSWAYRTGLRDVVTNTMAGIGMIAQHFFSDINTTKSSPDSYNLEAARSLYDWSMEAIAEYR